MRLSEIRRTTPFRLTLMNGAVFALAVVALLGVIYWRAADYMADQMDVIVVEEARALTKGGPEGLPERIRQAVKADTRRVEQYGLFSEDGVPIAGNVRVLPRDLPIDGRPRELHERSLQPWRSEFTGLN